MRWRDVLFWSSLFWSPRYPRLLVPRNHPRSAQIFLKKKGEEKREKFLVPSLSLRQRESQRERESPAKSKSEGS